MKEIKVEQLDKLEVGKKYLIESYGAGADSRIVIKATEYGILIRARSKQKEIKDENGSGTGKFETVKDVVVYKPNRFGVHATVIGGGLFAIYEEE